MTAHLPPNHDNRPPIVWQLTATTPKYALAFEMWCSDYPKTLKGVDAVIITPDGKVTIDWKQVRICAGQAMPKPGDESEAQAIAWALLAAHGDKP